MTEKEFLDKWRHLLAGMILEGMTMDRERSKIGHFALYVMRDVENILREIYRSLGQGVPLSSGSPQPMGSQGVIPANGLPKPLPAPEKREAEVKPGSKF